MKDVLREAMVKIQNRCLSHSIETTLDGATIEVVMPPHGIHDSFAGDTLLDAVAKCWAKYGDAIERLPDLGASE